MLPSNLIFKAAKKVNKLGSQLIGIDGALYVLERGEKDRSPSKFYQGVEG